MMQDGDAAQGPLFLTTRWSVVLAAQRNTSTDADAALETLCRTYWYPLYAYVRRSGQNPHDAQDLTQEFFARLLAKGWLQSAAQERGRFRTFLLVALKRFMAKEWRRASAQKRGGRETPLPLETVDAERRYAGEPVLTADEVFDRRWAMTLLEQTLEQLSADFQASGRAEEYEVLQEWLTAARGEIPYEQLAVRLGTTAGAARVAVHRLRQRFREYFREHVSHTVADPSATEDEMRHVAAILGSHA